MYADDGSLDWVAIAEAFNRPCSGSWVADGGITLPSTTELPALHLKHKIFILYFMFSAEIAASSFKEGTKQKALKDCAQFPASVFSKDVYHVNLHPDDIREYYHQVKVAAREIAREIVDANIPTPACDRDAVAQYLNLCMEDQDTSTEITSFAGLLEVGSNNSTSILPLYSR